MFDKRWVKICTWRWLAILWRVRQSIPISSKIREGTALSTPSCSTAWTNLLCSSGVQSTYTCTNSNITHQHKITNLTNNKSSTSLYHNYGSLSLSGYTAVQGLDSRDFFALQQLCEEWRPIIQYTQFSVLVIQTT